MKFEFEIQEILSKKIEIEADSQEKANEIIKTMYDTEDIVLTADDYNTTEIFALPFYTNIR